MDVVKPAQNQHRQDAVYLAGHAPQLAKINCPTITLAGNVINHSADVTVLGVVLDPETTFATHIRRLTGMCFYQLRQLRSVRSALTLDAFKTVVHSFVSIHVDYCNSVFSLARAKHLRPLQSVLNAAVRVISKRQKYDHITDRRSRSTALATSH